MKKDSNKLSATVKNDQKKNSTIVVTRVANSEIKESNKNYQKSTTTKETEIRSKSHTIKEEETPAKSNTIKEQEPAVKSINIKEQETAVKSNTIKDIESKFPSKTPTINIESKNLAKTPTNNFESASTHSGEKSTQIRVVARFRPLNQTEEELSKKDEGILCVKFLNPSTCQIASASNPKTDFTLDAVFDIMTTQKKFYDNVVTQTIKDCLNGYNGTIFTYGQSGAGKTFSMFGPDIYNQELKGIIPRAIDQIFDFLETSENEDKFLVTCSILEIYKENFNDLLNMNTKSSDLKIKEDPKRGTTVTNLLKPDFQERDSLFELINNAEENRTIAETRLNKQSSRSHIVFMISIKVVLQDGTEKYGNLNLIDLAGSEKVSKTGAVGETLEEAKRINSSLSALGNVIHALTSDKGDFVPYKDSKLTRLLKDSLGGNFKTTLIVACSPHSYNLEETISTLNFAKRAKYVKNNVRINIKRSPEELEKIIKDLNDKIKILSCENTKLKSGTVSSMSNSNNGGKNLEEIENNTELSLKILKYERLLIEKDNEISKLKDDVDGLTEDKNNLQKEIKELQKTINLDKIIEILEKSFRANLNDIEKNQKNYKIEIEKFYYEENAKLKDKLKNRDEINHNEMVKNLDSEYKFNFTSKLQSINLNFDDFLKNLRVFDSDQYIFKSYENIYKNSKLFLKDLLEDFVKKPDIFQNSQDANIDNQIEQITVDKNKYVKLKNSFLQTNALVIYYEKLLYELLGNLSVDLSKLSINEENYEINQKFSNENSQKITDLYNNFSQYIDVLQEVKKIKYKPTDSKTQLKDDSFKKKFIQRMKSKNSSSNLDGFGLYLKNIIDSKIKDEIQFDHKINEEQKNSQNNLPSSIHHQESKERTPIQLNNPPSEQIFTESSITEKKGMVDVMISTSESIEKTLTETSEPVVNVATSKKKPNIWAKLKAKHKKDAEKIENNEVDNNTLENKEVKYNNIVETTEKIKMEINTTKEDIVDPTKLSNINKCPPKTTKNLNLFSNLFVNQKDDNTEEIKLFRSEKLLYSNQNKILAREIAQFKSKYQNLETILVTYQESLKSKYKKEIENLKITYSIMKDFYNEEIIYNKNLINELSNIIDDMTITEKTIKNVKNKNVLSNLYLQKKSSLLDSNRTYSEGEYSLKNFAESYINESGTATKKLDYVHIHVNKDDKIEISYGSGLNNTMPTRCPLLKNLSHNLPGDNDLFSPNEY